MTETDEIELMTNEVQVCVERLLKELGVKNYTMNISAGTTRGDNYLGIIANVQVQGEDKNGNKTLNLLVKSAPRNESFRSMAPISEFYGREIYIYSKILPRFSQLQEEHGILKPFSSYAKYYRSTMEDMNEALIMENMKEIGYKLLNRHEPLDYNHVSLLMREYGKFHALSYAMRDQKPEIFEEICSNSDDQFIRSFYKTEIMKKFVQDYGKRALHSLDPVQHQHAYEKFNQFQQNILEGAGKCVTPGVAGKYAVINHGDCWVNNMLFKYGNSSTPEAPTHVCILDWQLSRLASPALDLSHFIFTCTDKELRDQHYDHFIQQYYDSLSSFLRQLGSDPEKLLPFQVLQEHMKRFSCYGLFMAVLVLYFMTSNTEEIPDIHTLTDDESWDKLNFESKNIEKYNSRIRGVILDFIKLGYVF